MAVTITATTVGVRTPAVVQVAVEGLVLGSSVRVVGVAGGSTWVVRGGQLAAPSTQVILLDDLAPVNRAVVYRVEVGGVPVATSAPVTVPFVADYLLTSVDGEAQVRFGWRDNGDPRAMRLDRHLTYVPGRRHPVVRYAAAGGESGEWRIHTTPDASAVLQQLIRDGAPVMVRTTGLIRDFEPVQIVSLTAASRELEGADGARVWSLAWVAVDDPLADTPVPGDTFADVDAGYAGTTFADLDAAYSGCTFADFNRADWSGMGV